MTSSVASASPWTFNVNPRTRFSGSHNKSHALALTGELLGEADNQTLQRDFPSELAKRGGRFLEGTV